MTKDLKEKAIKIQGKDYVLVSDRILFFNETYTNGSIRTEIVELKDNSVVMKAIVIPDVTTPEWYFTGYSQEVNDGKNFINKTSMIENAETSAVGRALAMMWIGVIDSIASVDEINKAKNRESTDEKPRYNDSNIEALKKAIADGSVTNAEETIKKIQEKFKLSTKNKEIVLSLFK